MVAFLESLVTLGRFEALVARKRKYQRTLSLRRSAPNMVEKA